MVCEFVVCLFVYRVLKGEKSEKEREKVVKEREKKEISESSI